MNRLPTLLITLLFYSAFGYAQEPLSVAIGASIPPYVDAQKQDGVELKILEAALEREGYRLVPKFLAGEGVRNNLRHRRIDAVLTNANIAFSDADLPALFAAPHHISFQNYAITRADAAITLTSVEDLRHYRVVAFYDARQALGPTYGDAVSQSPLYRELPLQRAQLLALARDQADVVIADRRIFEHYKAQLESADLAIPDVTYHPLFPESPRRLLFVDQHDRDRFERGLKRLRQSGQYQRIIDRYL